MSKTAKKRFPSAVRTPRRGAAALLYQRVREHILHDLILGRYAVGDRYRTETDLANHLNVCRNTVRKAMADLAKVGYFSRHRRIGTIVRKNPGLTPPVTGETNKPAQQRVIVILPGWDDSVEGFYTGKLLRTLSSPDLSPPLAVEIRHCETPVTDIQDQEAAIVSIDPLMETFSDLQNLTRQGRRIIMLEPRQPIPGLINLYFDRRSVTCRAVKRFYELGHKNVGLLNSTLAHLDYERTLLGYLEAHGDLGLPIPSHGIVQNSIYREEEKAPDVINISAWVCANRGSINIIGEACHRAGLSIPEDVSLISLDDPGDVVVPAVGKKVSVAHNDPEAAAKLIHTYLTDWREDRHSETIFIPARWKDRETIAPPSSRKV